MKKRLSSVMTLALGLLFSACSSQEEITPSAGIGYMTLGEVTADVTTRAAQTVSDMSKWQVTVTQKDAGEPAFSGTADQLASKGFSVNGNPYTVTASNYANKAAALQANDSWGDAFYTGSNTGVNIEAGKTTNVSIACGKAKNARLGVTFNESFTAVATGYALKVEKTGVSEGLTFDAQTAKDKYAYYTAAAEVNYTLTYTFNSEQKEVKGSVTLGGAATQKTLNVMLNSNGKIDLTITYDDKFESTPDKDITIDGATGEKTGE